MTWEVTIPDWVPDSRLSLNGRRRTHPMALAKLTTETKDIARWHLGSNALALFGVTDLAHVAVRFTYPTRRRRDPDGLAGLVKPLLDVLVDVGLLIDDDCEHITLTVAAEVQKGVTATRIRVEALEPRP